jgi:hypothetical protein
MLIKIADIDGLWVEIDYTPTEDMEQEVGVIDRIRGALSFGTLSQAIIRMSKLIKEQLAEADVSKATIEFGIGFAIESGQAITVIAKGSAQATVKVTLEWTGKTET